MTSATIDDVLVILTKLAADVGALKEQSKKQHEETLTAIADLSTRVSALETRVGALGTRVGALETSVGALGALGTRGGATTSACASPTA